MRSGPGRGYGEMKELFRSTVVRIAVLVIVVFFAVVFVSLRLKNNELLKEADELRREIDAAQSEVDSLNSELTRPLDDEYIAEIAHERLGMRYPQEIVFYSGEGEN